MTTLHVKVPAYTYARNIGIAAGPYAGFSKGGSKKSCWCAQHTTGARSATGGLVWKGGIPPSIRGVRGATPGEF